MTRKLTSSTTLENLRKEAKRWLKAIRAGNPNALERLRNVWADGPEQPVLRDVQHALAREYGYDNWKSLKQQFERRSPQHTTPLLARTAGEYETLAQDFVTAFDGDTPALGRLNENYRRSFTPDDLYAEVWRRVYAFRQRRFRESKRYLKIEEARMLIAQDAGFSSWEHLMRALSEGTSPPGAPYTIDSAKNRAAPGRRMTPADWDDLIAAMKERRLASLHAIGLMTDEVLARVAGLDHVTSLDLSGCREMTDDGLLHLARMPQLEHLNLSEYPGGKLTDRGLAVLRHLPNLRSFEMTWQAGISDAGVANLRFCDRLERVDLMGSPTGDGAIEALQGKPALRYFSTGRLVTDAGLPLLHNFPLLKNAAPGENGAHLLIDGPFTDSGVATLAGLDGVFEVDLFWHVTAITPDAFAHLTGLPNLRSLGCDGELSGDAAMAHIARLPQLTRLRAQESIATEVGFVALSASQTLEFFWGRECPNFGSRGFVAFSKVPALRGLGIGCKNVSDEALSALPDFPALRELTPIGFQDAGFRHIGRCPRLERLTCMYCRDTTDAATEHIAGLELKYYYAGLTKITDHSLAILGRMSSLEQIDLYECMGVTDAGLVFLADLPRLRELNLTGLPGVTLQGTEVFPEHVHVNYSTG